MCLSKAYTSPVISNSSVTTLAMPWSAVLFALKPNKPWNSFTTLSKNRTIFFITPCKVVRRFSPRQFNPLNRLSYLENKVIAAIDKTYALKTAPTHT
mmetsp:Transcript_9835/g.22141  ORF Transcript_9835/g.22141 Transcript_9835/m.22141 type:complete len:97 (-) Transcript_9835:818-1108(-)